MLAEHAGLVHPLHDRGAFQPDDVELRAIAFGRDLAQNVARAALLDEVDLQTGLDGEGLRCTADEIQCVMDDERCRGRPRDVPRGQRRGSGGQQGSADQRDVRHYGGLTNCPGGQHREKQPWSSCRYMPNPEAISIVRFGIRRLPPRTHVHGAGITQDL